MHYLSLHLGTKSCFTVPMFKAPERSSTPHLGVSKRLQFPERGKPRAGGRRVLRASPVPRGRHVGLNRQEGKFANPRPPGAASRSFLPARPLPSSNKRPAFKRAQPAALVFPAPRAGPTQSVQRRPSLPSPGAEPLRRDPPGRRPAEPRAA